MMALNASTGYAVEQYVYLDQLSRGEPGRFVVEAGVALGAALQCIEKVHDYFGKRDPVDQLDPLGR